MRQADSSRLKDFLDQKVAEYNQPGFIPSDPVSIPHRFSKKQDIEIAGLFAATFAWGNRTTIIRKSTELMTAMDNAPHDFIISHEPRHLQPLLGFKHRTFNDTDLQYFLRFLQQHYRQHESLEEAFLPDRMPRQEKMKAGLTAFHNRFFALDNAPHRTRKHVSHPGQNAACKRLNMFLRWMVRTDRKGVDFGLWKQFSPKDLIIPVDLHVARVSRKFGLIRRKQTDWATAEELTGFLRGLDPKDPVKYDFALFGLGAFENYR